MKRSFLGKYLLNYLWVREHDIYNETSNKEITRTEKKKREEERRNGKANIARC